MFYIQNNTVIRDSEHVFSLFYEIKQEFPLMDELRLMKMINQITGWEYQPNRKKELKNKIMRLLRLRKR